jgi:iron-sulfur cluster assembly protein
MKELTINPQTESVTLTPKAVSKVKEIMAQQPEQYEGLRVRVEGGGCSGFQYRLYFDKQPTSADHVYEYDGLKVFVDDKSLLYIKGTQIDFVEDITGTGFKFNNPQVKGTCGCGESFNV